MILDSETKNRPLWKLVSVKQKTKIGKAIQPIYVGQVVETEGWPTKTWSIITDISISLEQIAPDKATANLLVKRVITQNPPGLQKVGDTVVDIWVGGGCPFYVAKNEPAYKIIANPW